MSDASQFLSGGGIKPTGLINGGGSTASCLTQYPAYFEYIPGLKAVTSGSLVAGALTPILSLTGRGSLEFLGCNHTSTGTNRTHRIRMTFDGVLVYDETLASNDLRVPMVVLGQIVPVFEAVSRYGYIPSPLIFDKSLLIEYSSSLTEVAQTRFAYRYTPR